MKDKKQGKSGNKLIAVIAAVLLCAVAVTMYFSGKNNTSASDTVAAQEKNDNESRNKQTGENDSTQKETQVIGEGENLMIPVSDITTTASFYPVEVDGTSMEVLAIEDSDGNIRTAFNTCQICYGSGHGYYVQEGNELVCQNCGNRFTVDQVEIQSGGCNPWPIFAENKNVSEDTIEISYEFLKESEEIFQNWKAEF